MPAAESTLGVLGWFLRVDKRPADDANPHLLDVRKVFLDSPLGAYLTGLGVGLAAAALTLGLAATVFVSPPT